MNNILVRSLSGAVFISLVLIPLFWSNLSTVLIFGVFMILGLIEFYKLFKSDEKYSINWEVGVVLGTLIYGLTSSVLLDYLPKDILLIIPPVLFIGFILELWRKKENPILNVSILGFGLFYTVLPFILMVIISTEFQNYFPLLAGMFILIWMNDTFAFLSGKFFGRTKLIERISPNKTWEGTIGGFLFTILAGVAIGYLFDSENILFWVISGVIIAPCAAIGDLLESLFKRNMNVKDSGNIMPGHGGILDRFDATLFTVPFFLTWAYFYFNTYFC